MLRIILCLFFLFSSSCAMDGIAQNATIDSLKNLLPGTKGIERIDLLHELVKEYFYIDANAALPYVNEAINSIPQIQDSFRIVRAYRSKGMVLHRLGRYNEIIIPLNEGLSIARRNNFYDEVNTMLNLIGLFYTYTGEYDKALKYFFESLILRQSSDEPGLGVIYNNLGLVYYKLRNHKKALEFYRKSLQIRLEDTNWKNPENLYINIGLCYCELKDYVAALGHVNRGLLMCTDKYDQVSITGQFALGMIRFRMNDLATSEVHLDSSLLVSRINANARFIAENLVYLARIYLETGRFQSAEKALEESEAIAFDHDYKELLLDTYRVFIELFEKQRYYKNSSEYYSRFSLLREKLYGQELLQNIAAFQVDLEHHENVKTIMHQKQIVALQKDSLARAGNLYYGLGFIILLLSVIAVLVYRQILHKREMSKLLAERIGDRALKLQEGQRLLEQTEEELKQFITPFFNTIPGCLTSFEETTLNELRDNGALEYALAVQATIGHIKELMNSTCEFILNDDSDQKE